MKQPSFWRVVGTDYWSLLLFLLTVGCIVAFFFVVTIPLAFLSGYFLIKRTAMIRNVFEHGVTVTGQYGSVKRIVGWV
ncbi:hypothetical protein [Nostoc sp. FACHB-110]|uniref:hypothetical protein n=1 Tax=Nostoc sp. FACHB-110 TaxID=2692834 RepID=UPI0016836CF3|nr:hypothetical protein [Nostoc sp. FACHB-110]MBD2436083.1 hypothetical protein [Nostoc sp. FACHB-110]